jgi:hypothetical protein
VQHRWTCNCLCSFCCSAAAAAAAAGQQQRTEETYGYSIGLITTDPSQWNYGGQVTYNENKVDKTFGVYGAASGEYVSDNEVKGSWSCSSTLEGALSFSSSPPVSVKFSGNNVDIRVNRKVDISSGCVVFLRDVNAAPVNCTAAFIQRGGKARSTTGRNVTVSTRQCTDTTRTYDGVVTTSNTRGASLTAARAGSTVMLVVECGGRYEFVPNTVTWTTVTADTVGETKP